MPGADAKRALLEAIAYGVDPKVTPRDQLQALDMLNRLDQEEPRRPDFYEELSQMTPQQLERDVDAWSDYEPEEIAALVSGTSTRQPRLAAAIHAEVERRMRESTEGES